jgi:predicted ATPase
MSYSDLFYIITGGPGSGKSTLIAALAAQGCHAMPEAGRAIIQDQVAVGGSALPWADKALFAELMLGWELRSYREAGALTGAVLFDRGMPDVAAYLSLCGLEVPPHIRRAAEQFRYSRRVFIAPPWAEIFMQDAERKQDFAEAEATYRALVGIYDALDYELVELPRASVAERTLYVRQRIGLGAP